MLHWRCTTLVIAQTSAAELANLSHGSNQFEKKEEEQNCSSTPTDAVTLQEAAAIAAELANLPHGGRVYRTDLHEGPNDPSSITDAVTLQEAADMMGVGRKTVVNAKRRMVDDPEAHEAAKRGVKMKKKSAPRYSWQGIAVEEGIMQPNSGGSRQLAKDDLLKADPELNLTNPDHAQRLREACALVRQHRAMEGRRTDPTPPEIPVDSLPKKHQRELERHLAQLRKEFEAEVHKEAARMLNSKRETELKAAKDRARRANDLADAWHKRLKDSKSFLFAFRDSRRTIASSVHPDRPERTPEQLQAASVAMNKLNSLFNEIKLDEWGT